MERLLLELAELEKNGYRTSRSFSFKSNQEELQAEVNRLTKKHLSDQINELGPLMPYSVDQFNETDDMVMIYNELALRKKIVNQRKSEQEAVQVLTLFAQSVEQIAPSFDQDLAGFTRAFTASLQSGSYPHLVELAAKSLAGRNDAGLTSEILNMVVQIANITITNSMQQDINETLRTASQIPAPASTSTSQPPSSGPFASEDT